MPYTLTSFDSHVAHPSILATHATIGAGKLYGCGKVPFEIAGRKTPCEVKVPTLIDSIPPSVRVVAIRAGEKHVLVALGNKFPPFFFWFPVGDELEFLLCYRTPNAFIA